MKCFFTLFYKFQNIRQLGLILMLHDSLGGILEGPTSSLGETALKIVLPQLGLTNGLFLPGILSRCTGHNYMSAQSCTFLLLIILLRFLLPFWFFKTRFLCVALEPVLELALCWPWTHGDPFASASRVLALKTCATITHLLLLLEINSPWI